MAIYIGAKVLSRWPINNESTLTGMAPGCILKIAAASAIG